MLESYIGDEDAWSLRVGGGVGENRRNQVDGEMLNRDIVKAIAAWARPSRVEID